MLQQYEAGNMTSKITDEMLCAGGEEGKDSCGGDSGAVPELEFANLS